MASTPIKDFTSPWTKTTKEKKNQKNLLRIIKSSRSPEYSEEANKRSVDRGKRVYSFVTQHKRNYRRMGASEGGGRDGPRGEVGGGVFGWERSVGRAELLIPFQRLVRSSETGAPGESGVKSKIIAKRKTAARIRGRKSERRKVGKGEGGGAEEEGSSEVGGRGEEISKCRRVRVQGWRRDKGHDGENTVGSSLVHVGSVRWPTPPLPLLLRGFHRAAGRTNFFGTPGLSRVPTRPLHGAHRFPTIKARVAGRGSVCALPPSMDSTGKLKVSLTTGSPHGRSLPILSRYNKN